MAAGHDRSVRLPQSEQTNPMGHQPVADQWDHFVRLIKSDQWEHFFNDASGSSGSVGSSSAAADQSQEGQSSSRWSQFVDQIKSGRWQHFFGGSKSVAAAGHSMTSGHVDQSGPEVHRGDVKSAGHSMPSGHVDQSAGHVELVEQLKKSGQEDQNIHADRSNRLADQVQVDQSAGQGSGSQSADAKWAGELGSYTKLLQSNPWDDSFLTKREKQCSDRENRPSAEETQAIRERKKQRLNEPSALRKMRP
jgi:hypothetical protein